MPKDESFPLRFLHAIDRMIAPKDKPRKGPSPEVQARRAKVDYEMNRPGRGVDYSEDDIASQVDRLRRRRKAFSLNQSDEPDL